MQIQRVQTGSETTNVAGQVQRGARGHHQHKKVDPTEVDPAALVADSGDVDATQSAKRGTDPLAGLATGSTKSKTPDAVPAASADSTSTSPTAALHPRLAAFAQRIEGRLAHAAGAPDLTPRQQAAIQEAQTQFHGLIQRLDNAYSSSESMAKKKPMIESLNAMIEHLAQSVSHIQSGGPLDVRG